MPALKMKQFLIAAMLLVSGCSNNTDSAAPLPVLITPDAILSDCNNALFPIKMGASWMYFSSGGPNGDFTYTDTITEFQSSGFTLTSTFPTLTLTQKWVCTPEGLVAQQLGGGTIGSVSMQNMIADFTTLEVRGVSLPREITTGLQWEYQLSMNGSVAMPGEQSQSPGTFTLTMNELGSESVTVAAGTFEAVKIQAVFNAQINIDFQGSAVPYAINGSSILWYAPGVGYIKSIENIDFSGTPFTSTTELQTYNIP